MESIPTDSPVRYFFVPNLLPGIRLGFGSFKSVWKYLRIKNNRSQPQSHSNPFILEQWFSTAGSQSKRGSWTRSEWILESWSEKGNNILWESYSGHVSLKKITFGRCAWETYSHLGASHGNFQHLIEAHFQLVLLREDGSTKSITMTFGV